MWNIVVEGYKPQDFSFFHCSEKLVQQKVMSPFDTSADESRYNRINRLRDLDEYIDQLKKI